MQTILPIQEIITYTHISEIESVLVIKRTFENMEISKTQNIGKNNNKNLKHLEHHVVMQALVYINKTNIG